MKASVFIMPMFVWQVMSFSPSIPHVHVPTSTKMYNAMERLHDPSTNAFGPVEHIYSLAEIDTITNKIEDDEWTALGSSIAESLLETILDVCSSAVRRMSWADRMDITDQVAMDVSKTVEKSLQTIRCQPLTFDDGQYSIPDELLRPLYDLVLKELRIACGDDSFECNSQNLSLLVISSVGEAIETYLGSINVNAPFFSLQKHMKNRVCSRRMDLLVMHSKGCDNVKDVENDIVDSRREWVRVNLGRKAANTYHFGEITTKVGNEHNARKRRKMPSIWNALIQDLDGVLVP